MEPIKIPYHRYQRVLGPFVSVLTLVWGIGIFVFGLLLIFDSNDLSGIEFLFGAIVMLILISRFYYTPLEITDKHIICRFFFIKKSIPIKNIKIVRRKIFADFKSFSFMKPTDRESLLLKIDGIFLKYIYFTRLERSLRISDSLVQRNKQIIIKDLWI